MMPEPNMMTATALAEAIDSGALSAESIVRATLDRIDAR